MSFLKSIRLALIAGALFVVMSPSTYAHFVWLTIVTDEVEPQATLFFSEAGDIPGDKLPGGVADATVWLRVPGADRQQLGLKKVEADGGDVCMSATIAKSDACSIETECTYGLYHGTLLTYYSRSIHAGTAVRLSKVADSDLKLDIVPELVGAGLRLRVTWNGKPLVDAPFSVVTPGGDELDQVTNADGVSIVGQREAGLYSFRSNHEEKGLTREFQGEPYTEQHHYATLTYVAPAPKPGEEPLDELAEQSTDKSSASSGLAPLPEGIASFGGAVLDGWVYVYSGHIGRAHDHSADNLSQSFRRLNLKTKQGWESLPMQTPLQGLALVAHKGMLYRIGGLTASNSQGDDEVLKSVAEFARFDPKKNEWTRLADLPGPRSSFDAVVVGDRIYVVGGWNLDGMGDDGEWYDTALVIDLSEESPQWTEFECPFRRRALAAGTVAGKIFALGGMNEMSDIDRGVDVYDPATGDWAKGPELLGDGMDGFGVSAWQIEDELFVSGASGIVLQLSADRASWIKNSELIQGRFFHRLLPLDGKRLVAVGGASNNGHLRDLESVSVRTPEVVQN